MRGGYGGVEKWGSSALLFLFVEASAGINPGCIFTVPLIENGSPFVEVFDADELIAHFESFGMGSGVLDPKFP